jgi:exopolyphosphatase/guanosine-5'-triphosphate,3'-diphosphate pyrophosphatase
MFAAIDIGSNTLRMLIGRSVDGQVVTHKIYRQVTRLSGDFCDKKGLAQASMQRALDALTLFSKSAQQEQVGAIKAVATEAVRRAPNRNDFINRVKQETGIDIEVIDGNREAVLTTSGVLSVVKPLPTKAIIMDIGGGSTELVCLNNGQVMFQHSYPLGVVRLCEEAHDEFQRQSIIENVFTEFRKQLETRNLFTHDYCLIGTAGTVTTLAAMHLELGNYNQSLINNHVLPLSWLEMTQEKLLALSPVQRENIIGMEQGRGDLIPHGISIILAFCRTMSQGNLKVSDSGLLEGLLMEMAPLH